MKFVSRSQIETKVIEIKLKIERKSLEIEGKGQKVKNKQIYIA